MIYEVVTSSEIMDLEAKVDQMIQRGWRLQGGVSIARWTIPATVGDPIEISEYAQAMVKEDQ